MTQKLNQKVKVDQRELLGIITRFDGTKHNLYMPTVADQVRSGENIQALVALALNIPLQDFEMWAMPDANKAYTLLANALNQYAGDLNKCNNK